MVMFIPKSKVHKDKKVTYGKIVCEMKPENIIEGVHKSDSERKLVRLHRKSQRPNSISNHGKVCLSQCGINPRGQVSIS